jgi:diguanylate cyclase
MSTKPPSSQFKSPSDIARETFRQLAIQRIAPTPDAYRKLYNEVAGIIEEAPATTTPETIQQTDKPSEAENLLANFASSLQASQSDLSTFGHRFSRAVKTGNWDDYSKGLELLTQRITEPPVLPIKSASLILRLP